MATPAQVEANRANAQHSTGPLSAETKAKVSHNALKTGLTGRTILLPTDDVAAYEALIAHINRKFSPATDEEKHLTQSIADTEWRLLRIPTLEAGTFALGRNELAAEFANESNPQTRAAMIEALVQRTYRKDLSNLALQESRLRKQLEKFTAKLEQLQDDRHSLVVDRLNKITVAMSEARMRNQPFDFSTIGSEFSKEHLLARYEAYSKRRWEGLPQFDRAWRANLAAQAA